MNYVIGSSKEWIKVEDIKPVLILDTLRKGESAEYVFQWKWDFESGNDEYDTFLGSLANGEAVGIKVELEITAEANTAIGENGGIVESGAGNIIFAVVFLILLALAIILTTVYLVKKRKQGYATKK